MDYLSRRNLMQGAGVTAFAPAIARAAVHQWPFAEGPDTPKICVIPSGTGEGAIRRVKQLGVGHVVGASIGPIPWREDDIRSRIEFFKAGGLKLYNLMIGGYPNTQIGRPGRDEEIDKVLQSIRAAGRAGLPVIEYTFQPRRAMGRPALYSPTSRKNSTA